jgi:cytolysin (calcineurin-like family phosphatase)
MEKKEELNEVRVNITREDNEKIYNTLTDEEKYKMHLDTYRGLRNQKLKKTDQFMMQIDRFSQKQMEQLKTYRQDLRDMINNNHDKFQAREPVLYPPIPDFIREHQV